MEDRLLLSPNTRWQLARVLQDRPKPRGIDRPRWEALLDGEATSLSRQEWRLLAFYAGEVIRVLLGLSRGDLRSVPDGDYVHFEPDLDDTSQVAAVLGNVLLPEVAERVALIVARDVLRATGVIAG